MKALSIRQPWADLILSGLKDVENRTWKTSYRGILAIHASKTFDIKGYRVVMSNARALQLDFGICHDYILKKEKDQFTKGAIIGTVNLVDIVEDYQIKSKWAIDGMFHWVLEDPVLVNRFYCKGQLGIFDVRDWSL